MLMIDKTLLNWLKDAKAKGYSENDLHKILEEKGFDDYTITNAFLEINKINGAGLYSQKRFYVYLFMMGIFLIVPIWYFASMSNAYNPDSNSFNEEVLSQAVESEPDKNEMKSCSNPQCFNQRFLECLPSKLLLGGGTVQNYYKIVGKNGSYCNVINVVVIGGVNGSIKNQINCNLDYSKPFGLAMQDTKRCDGSIYENLK